MANEKRLCVLGVGNLLLSDEGFGVRAMEYLRDRYDWAEPVDFVDGGTLGRGLMPLLRDYDRVLVLDVVLGQGEPGTVYLLENEDMRKSASFRDSTHDTDFVDLLSTCDLLGGRPDCIVVGLEPFDCHTLKAELTEQAKALLPAFCRKAAMELVRRGWASGREKDA